MTKRLTADTLHHMVEEFGLIPMNDTELEIVTPQVQVLVDGMAATNSYDVSFVRSSHVFRASLHCLSDGAGTPPAA